MSTERGVAAEDRAAAHLVTLGYTVVTRRYHARHGEIDLVCLDGDILVFVEVKFRNSAEAVAEHAIGEEKISRLRRAAAQYLAEFSEGREARFDVVAIDRQGIRLHRDVFRD